MATTPSKPTKPAKVHTSVGSAKQPPAGTPTWPAGPAGYGTLDKRLLPSGR